MNCFQCSLKGAARDIWKAPFKNEKVLKLKRMFYSLWVTLYLASGLLYLIGNARIFLASECTVRSRPQAPAQIAINSFKIPKHTFPETKTSPDILVESNHFAAWYALLFCSVPVLVPDRGTRILLSRCTANKAPPTQHFLS